MAQSAACGRRYSCNCCRSNAQCGGPVLKVHWGARGGCCSRGRSIGLIPQLGPNLGRNRAGNKRRRPFWRTALGERFAISFLEVGSSAPRTGSCSSDYLALAGSVG